LNSDFETVFACIAESISMTIVIRL
jgi:hypothetical protein